MIGCLLSFLLAVLIVALFVAIAQWVLSIAGVPFPPRIVAIVAAIIVLILLINYLPCFLGGGPVLWHWGPYGGH